MIFMIKRHGDVSLMNSGNLDSSHDWGETTEEVVSHQHRMHVKALGLKVGLQIRRSVFIQESMPGMNPGRKRLNRNTGPHGTMIALLLCVTYHYQKPLMIMKSDETSP